MSSGAALPILVVIVAGTLAGFTGFGFNIIAVPALTLWITATDAVALALIVGTALSIAVGITSRREINRGILGTLLLGSVPGLAIGMMIVPIVDEQALRLCVGVATVAIAILLAASKHRGRARGSRAAGLGAGMVSGGLNALLGMGGPPAAAYMLVQANAAEYARSTMLGFVAATGGCTLVLRSAAGHLHIDQVMTSGLLLVPALFGVLIGTRMYRAAPSLHAAASIATIALLGFVGTVLTLSTSF